MNNAYIEGFKAYHSDTMRNPYEKGSKEYNDWFDGWDDAEYEDEVFYYEELDDYFGYGIGADLI